MDKGILIRDFSKDHISEKNKSINFMIGFIYFFLLFFSILLLWMYFSKIDVVVNATGIVRPNKNESIIINANNGNMKDVYYTEGKEVKKGELLYVVDITSFKLQEEVTKTSKEKLEIAIAKLKTLEKSIATGNNLFSSGDTEFYNRYSYYQLKQEQLRLEYSQTNSKYIQEKSLGDNFTSQNSLREYKQKLEMIKTNMEQNKSEMLYNVRSEIITKEEELLKSTNELKEIEKNIGLNRVTSPIDGTIQVIKNYNIGDYINAGTEVVKIIPKDAKLKMEISVNNKDISQIRLEEKAKFRFLAFPYKEYGILEGKIKKISGDVIVNNENNNGLYKVEADIPKNKLYNRDGKEGIIKVGMISEVRVVTKRKRVLYIILEKLDFMKDV